MKRRAILAVIVGLAFGLSIGGFILMILGALRDGMGMLIGGIVMTSAGVGASAFSLAQFLEE